jgi:hypothetical protein
MKRVQDQLNRYLIGGAPMERVRCPEKTLDVGEQLVCHINDFILSVLADDQ